MENVGDIGDVDLLDSQVKIEGSDISAETFQTAPSDISEDSWDEDGEEHEVSGPYYDEEFEDPCYHYVHSSELPKALRKFWRNRYDFFSKYDDGILFTEDAWYGVTPEPIAEAIAAHMAETANPNKSTLVDAFAGIGGNTIAFAKSGRWDSIIAFEVDEFALRCAMHNARIYGVDGMITWVHGDCFEKLHEVDSSILRQLVIFGSPPWGGPGYLNKNIFDLSQMQPYSLPKILDAFADITEDIVLYLPRTSDLRQLADFHAVEYHNHGYKLPVMHYLMKGFAKALCVYFGNFDFSQLSG